MTDRDEFERRLLALVRDYMDDADRLNPDGYDIEDFMVLYQLRIAPSADEPLRPWDGGSQPGWWPAVASSSTSRSYWQEESLLTEMLERIRAARAATEDAAGEEEEDEDQDEQGE